MEILTWTQRKTIIQTQFVFVVSKVISDGIFNERFFFENKKKTLAK